MPCVLHLPGKGTPPTAFFVARALGRFRVKPKFGFIESPTSESKPGIGLRTSVSGIGLSRVLAIAGVQRRSQVMFVIHEQAGGTFRIERLEIHIDGAIAGGRCYLPCIVALHRASISSRDLLHGGASIQHLESRAITRGDVRLDDEFADLRMNKSRIRAGPHIAEVIDVAAGVELSGRESQLCAAGLGFAREVASEPARFLF
jgi:hypothetical protein